jgi:hypothetical protein
LAGGAAPIDGSEPPAALSRREPCLCAVRADGHNHSSVVAYRARVLHPESAQVRFALAVVVFVASWGLLHFWFYAHDAVGDVHVYQSYGLEIRHGHVPYRDFALEYPPGALPVFIAPTFAGDYYRSSFGWLMAACGVGCLACVALCRPPRFALPFLAVSPLLIGNLVLSRYDFWPTLLVTGGLAALLHDRHRLGGAALGAAFATKLFAAVLLPLALLWTLRRRGPAEAVRALAVWIAVVAAAFVPFAVVAPHGLWKSIAGQLSRPLQIETLAASFLMTFAHPVIRSSHGSKNLIGYDTLAAATTAVGLLLIVAFWIWFARGPAVPQRLVRSAAACVCAFVAFGKVLSPQYMIWLVPLVPLVHGRRGLAATGLLVAALLDTDVWFPARYFSDYVYQPKLAWLVLVRNLLLVAVFVVLAAPAAVTAFVRSRRP